MANKFSAEVADKLLDKLSTDQSFRDLFEKNPRAALRKVGHETPDEDLDIKGRDPVLCAYNMSGGLASMEDIRAARDTIKASLTSVMAQAIFKL